ncbi:hypothetical protein EVAR_23358_1 [Eumeta japonica]|uniref:Uncharacterized protein n=1 Tax=Eumeta variegata TaxID=151549 RepID=A0A4C1VVZ6_EUMVA|nr:hypothetical protein EVAR_23358_1 [Eumeta japonica]
MSILHTLAPVRSVETSQMTSQTTLIVHRVPDGTCECRRRVTYGRRLVKSSRHRMSQETVGSVPFSCRPEAVSGGRVE